MTTLGHACKIQIRWVGAALLVSCALALSGCWRPQPAGLGRDPWDPADDDPSTATALRTPGASVSTHAGHTLSANDRADWFSVFLEAGCEYVIRTTNVSGTLRGELYRLNAGLTTLIAASGGTCSSPAPRFTYTPATSERLYLRLITQPEGADASYSLEYEIVPPLRADEFDPRDNVAHRGTQLAEPTSAAQSHAPHTLTPGDPVDWYVVYLRPGIGFTCWTSLTRGDSTLELYENPSAPELAFDDDGGTGLGSQISFAPVREGWHYIAVRAYRGAQTAYTLHWRSFELAELDPWDPQDDSAGRATLLTAPLSVPTLHGPHVLTEADREDWYAAYLVAGTRYYFEATSGPGDTVGYLYWADQSDFTYVAANDDSGEGLHFRIVYTASQSGWYKLLVFRYPSTSGASYTLTYGIL